MKWLFALLYLVLITSQAVLAAPSIDKSWDQEAEGTGDRAGYSSPAVAELDGNKGNGKEIVAASINGTITAVRADGTIFWEARTPDSGCGGPSRINSSPAIGALYGDGVPYVVIGYGPFAKRCQGGVVAINGRTGETAWKFSTKDFAKKEKFWAVLHAVFSSPAIADVDGDGKMEVGFGSFDRNVYLLNNDGTVRWYYNAADTIWSSPTFANIDNTPNLEMILGTDISGNSKIRPITKNGGILYAFKTIKSKNKKFNFRDPKAFVWMKPVEQVLFSSPVVGEVIPTNAGPEVVINSGCFFPQRTNNKVGKWSRIFSGKTGKLLRTLRIEACSSSRVALSDINNDGQSEVFVSVNGSTSVGGDGSSRLKAFDGATGALLWSIIPSFRGRNYQWGGNFISPVVTDLFNDGGKQVIIPVASGVGVYNAVTGEAITCESATCPSSGLGSSSLRTADILLNSVKVVDVDTDGALDIIAAGKSFGGKLGIFRWSLSSPVL
jgi:outer membrane protein assembly factor BamB